MNQTAIKHLLALSTQAAEKGKLEEFFQLFLTDQEMEMLGKRLLVVQALLQGRLTQREIAKREKVSISQITRGSNALKKISPSLKKSLLSWWA
jgi:TrpR family trp operon transcriptional repressor